MPLPYHESFPQPPDPSVLAWRYIDTPKLVSLLLGKALHLGRVDLLPDKFEGTHTRPTRSLLLTSFVSAPPLGAGIELNQAQRMVDHIASSATSIRKTFYASCWHLGNHESEAMWRLYCGVREGAAIVLPYAKLRDSLHDDKDLTYIGTMNYIDYNTQVIPARNAFNVVMHKRREFEYEREARIVAWRPPPAEDWFTAEMASSITLPWAPEEHLEKIVISPYAEAWYLEVIRELVARISPTLKERVTSSSMGGGPYT